MEKRIKTSDLVMFHNCNVWAASPTYNKSMESFVVKTSESGSNHFFSAKNFFEKIQLAAQVICGVGDPKEILAVASAPISQRPVSRFAQEVGATSQTGKFIPGTLTNKSLKTFAEARVLVVSDTFADAQAIRESMKENVPIIALCDSDSVADYVDVVIPCNNKVDKAVAFVFFMLTRTILKMRGNLDMNRSWKNHFGYFINISDQELEELSQKVNEENVEGYREKSHRKETDERNGYRKNRMGNDYRRSFEHREKRENPVYKRNSGDGENRSYRSGKEFGEKNFEKRERPRN